MSKGSILIYTSAAGQAAPLAGVALTVLDESGTALAHLTADADGRAEAADLPAPDAAYSLDAANTAVRPLRTLPHRGRTGRLAAPCAGRCAGL